MTQTADAPAFFAALRASGLIPAVVLEKVTAELPAGACPADALVAAGHLTRFQAARLRAGRADGFHLGPYVILEQVGRGSLARVYRARHQTMNRLVAIKVLAPSLTGTAAAKEAFHREVRAAAQLNHPNVVTAYDANEVGERFYLVLEYVDGPTLDALVAARGPLPVAEACGYVRQAAMGLQHAHELGMVHRDLKPSNVLVTRPGKTHAGGEVKVADFGIGRLAPVASPDFVAPELVHDPRAADHRADLYALGCVFYFLLAGRPPFPGGTPADKVRRHQWDAPTPLDRVRPDVPPAVAGLVYALLAKHPLSRIARAGEVAERLDGLWCADDAVSYEMPPLQPGQYSFAGSGGHAAVTDTSPWTQLTDDGGTLPDIEITPVATRVRPRARRQPGAPWAMVVSLSAAAAVLLAVVVRALGK